MDVFVVDAELAVTPAPTRAASGARGTTACA